MQITQEIDMEYLFLDHAPQPNSVPYRNPNQIKDCYGNQINKTVAHHVFVNKPRCCVNHEPPNVLPGFGPRSTGRLTHRERVTMRNLKQNIQPTFPLSFVKISLNPMDMVWRKLSTEHTRCSIIPMIQARLLDGLSQTSI